MWWRKHDNWQYVQRFWYSTSVLQTDGQTDRRTDVQTISITCFSIADARKKLQSNQNQYRKSDSMNPMEMSEFFSHTWDKRIWLKLCGRLWIVQYESIQSGSLFCFDLFYVHGFYGRKSDNASNSSIDVLIFVAFQPFSKNPGLPSRTLNCSMVFLF